MKYRMLALDIDGTLIGTEETVSPDVVAAVRAAQQAGMRVCIATGRDYDSAIPVWRQLKLDPPHDPIILVGGAMVSEVDTGRTLYQKTIPRSMAIECGLVLQQAGYCVMARVDGWRYDVDYYCTSGGLGWPIIEPWFKKRNLRVRFAERFDGHADMPNPLRLSVFTAPGAAADLETTLRGQFGDRLTIHSIYVPAYDFTVLEAFSFAASKLEALVYIAQSLRIGKGHIAAVGDDMNDLPMIRGAGLGVAMPRAPRMVQDAADHVAADGLSTFIREMLDGKFG